MNPFRLAPIPLRFKVFRKHRQDGAKSKSCRLTFLSHAACAANESTPLGLQSPAFDSDSLRAVDGDYPCNPQLPRESTSLAMAANRTQSALNSDEQWLLKMNFGSFDVMIDF